MNGIILYGFERAAVRDSGREPELPEIVQYLKKALGEGQKVYFLPDTGQERIHPAFEQIKSQFITIKMPFVHQDFKAPEGYSAPLQILGAKKRCLEDHVTGVEVIEELGKMRSALQNITNVFMNEGAKMGYTWDKYGVYVNNPMVIGIDKEEFENLLTIKIPVRMYEPSLR